MCRTLRRERRQTPILMLSARDRIEDRVRGLDAGADPERGWAIFAKKCSPCHFVGGGERVGPDLGIASGFGEPLAVMAAPWNHAPKMDRELRTRSLPWPRLEAGEAADLTAFLLSRRPGASAAPTAPR